MKIPPVKQLGRFVVPKRNVDLRNKQKISAPPKKDVVMFSASTAYYLKKYNTLPDEIKKVLSPKDAIDMFRNMELVQKGAMKGVKIGEGNYGKVYENPWLEGYYSLFVKDPDHTTQIIYSRHSLGDAVWSDSSDETIQIIKKI